MKLLGHQTNEGIMLFEETVPACAFFPRSVAHASKNTRRALFLYTPAVAGGYLEKLTKRPAGPMSTEERDKLCERYRREVVGPNPL